MSKVLVIGAGPAGCVAAHMLGDRGFDVTLVERGPELGGSCRTYWWGGHPYTLGPRHFLTRKQEVWDFLDRYCPMKQYEGHEFLTYVERDQQFYHFPIHRDEIKLMPDADRIEEELKAVPGAEAARNLEEYWIMSVGQTLYNKIVEGYSKKMWDIDDNRIITDFGFTPKGVALKEGPVRAAWTEAMSGFPKAADGYNDYFDRASVANATVRLNTNIEAFDMEKRRVRIAGEWSQWDIIVSTVSPEIILNDAFGPLRWMGRDFMKIVLPVERVFPEHVYFLYYAGSEPFTRIVEYKQFYDNVAPTTLLGIEVPSKSNKLYPFPTTEDQAIAQRYLDALPADVHSVGRAGTYRYIDFGNIIDQGLELYPNL